ncbi:unnamed protein product [Mucor fragilis]
MANKSFAVDHIDLVSSDLKDFMDNCDLDDLMSRPDSRPNASASPLQPYRHSKDGLTSSRLSSHNRAEQKKQQETTSASTLLQKLSEPHQQHRQDYKEVEPSAPLRHTNHDGYSNPVIHTHKPTRNSVNDSANTNKYEPPPMSVLEKPKSKTMQSILSKRRSIDSAGLKRLQQSHVEPTPNDSRLLSKRHSMMSISEYEPAPAKSKLPTTVQRRNSNLQQPAVFTATLKRRNSNMQQPTTATASLQRRNSNLQSTLSKTNTQRRNSSNVDPPVEPEVVLERRNSKTQPQAQPDRRRWSSYIPDHNVVVENQVPQRDMPAPQRTSRQEPRKLLNRNSMLLPSSGRQYSREEEEEQVYGAPSMSQRRPAREKLVYEGEASPPMYAQSTAEKVRHRHTLSASDKRASLGPLPRHTADKRASLHLAASRVHATVGEDEDVQIDNVPQVQQRRLLNNDRRSHQIKTSSYERSMEEPNRYRSKLRNPIVNREYESQLSSSLMSTVLANSKHLRDYQQHTTRLSKRSELQLQSSHDEAARYRHEPSDLVQSQAYEYEQAEEDLVAPPPRYVSRGVVGEQRHNQLLTTASTATQQRRNRAQSAPSNHQQATDKPSLMPVHVRYRKHSNNSISKYTSVPENAGLTSFSPPREARLYPEEIIQVEASRSSGGLSNSTTSSSHSSDRYYDPPTPPTSAVNTTYGSHGKRRSVPVMNASIIDEQVRKTENRYSSYLARIKKDTLKAEHEDTNPSRRLVPRRQRVVSEDNESYRQQIEQRTRPQQHQAYRDEDTEDVISSAKHLLSMVKERRNRAH